LFVESIVVAGLPILAVFRHCFWLLGCTSSHPNNAGFRYTSCYSFCHLLDSVETEVNKYTGKVQLGMY
jgi:hypothetical protein